MKTLSIRLYRMAFVLLFLISAVYAESLRGSFHFDDSHSIESNPAVHSPANILQFWTDPRTSSFIPENRVYRPLVYTFYSFCWWLGGGQTWPFHIMKILMHWMVAVALFMIWRRLWSERGWFPVKRLKIKPPFFGRELTVTPTRAAFLLAALFAIHPAGSECVDYISATTSLQCAAFYVWGFFFYLTFRKSNKTRDLAVSLLFYFLSVASKEEGITLPAMVLISELLLLTGPIRTRFLPALRRTVPYILLGAVLGGWIFLMRPSSGDESRGYATSFEYFMTQWRAYLYYMRILVWPVGLNADNASIEFSRSFGDPWVVLALLGNLLVLGGAWLGRKRYPSILFGVLWFYVTISPASSVVVLAEAINEHRMYLAYVGFVGASFSLVLAMVDRVLAFTARTSRLSWASCAIAIALVAVTHERNHVWASDENLWLDTVEKNPTSGRALNNLALVYMQRGDFKKAIEYFDQCQHYWSSYAYCPLNRGIIFQAMARTAETNGKREEAETNRKLAREAYQRAYELSPRNVHINFHFAEFSEECKEDRKAIEYYKAAIQLTGNAHWTAEVKVIAALTRIGEFGEAHERLQALLAREPEDVNLFFETGRLALERNDLQNASEVYRKLTEHFPGHVKAWYNYGVALLRRELLNDAARAFERVVSLDKKSEQGWYNLAFVSERLGNRDGATQALRQLTVLKPERQDYRARLSQLQEQPFHR